MGGRVALKICGLTREDDVRACIELGVDAIGLNLWPGSKRHVTLDQAARLVAVPGIERVQRVGVVVDMPIAELDVAIEALGLDLIQQHGDAPVEPYAELARRRGIGWIRVVRGVRALPPAHAGERVVLLDAAVAGYGGAGQTTDWDWAARVVEAVAPLPVWLAGGIGVHNVRPAIQRVKPAGVDVASGAEVGGQPGIKDRGAIEALVELVRK